MLSLRLISKLDSQGPISCDVCSLASVTAYSPTVCADHARITNIRKNIQYVAADKIIVRQGETLEFVQTVEAGWAFQFRTLSDGRRQILAFIIPGDIISLEVLLLDMLALPFSIRSVTPLRLCTFEKTEFRSVLSRAPEQRKRLAEEATSYMENMLRRTSDIGRRTASGRLAQLILELRGRLSFRRLGSGDVFPFPLKQEHIADALGLTVIYVNRSLMNFRKDGIIDFDRKTMKVLDLDGLRRIADEG